MLVFGALRNRVNVGEIYDTTFEVGDDTIDHDLKAC